MLPDIEDFEPVQMDLSERADVPFQVPNTYYDIRVKERANNQYTSINSVSTGCKKILYVLTMALAAGMNGDHDEPLAIPGEVPAHGAHLSGSAVEGGCGRLDFVFLGRDSAIRVRALMALAAPSVLA